MKPFRLPWLWFGVWCAMGLAVVVASLGQQPPSPDVPESDKWMHLTTYAMLSAGAVQVFRRGSPLLLAAALTVLAGIALEIAQGTLTTDRMMDWRDAVANTVGVGLGLATSCLPLRDALLRVEARSAD